MNTEQLASSPDYLQSLSGESFWQQAISAESTAAQRALLTNAMAAAYHWQAEKDETLQYLAYLAVAQAFAYNHIDSLAKEYACKAHAYFKHSDQAWIRAMSHAVLSHALMLSGQQKDALAYQQEAKSIVTTLAPDTQALFSQTLARLPMAA